jgi:hypothetical protein
MGIVGVEDGLHHRRGEDTMPVMSKKKPAGDAHKGIQVPFRVGDERLIAALEVYAQRTRRSRNMTIVLLLEEALTRHGLWPPGAQTQPLADDGKHE